MKIFYNIDEQNRVHPCCDWSEDIEPDAEWRVGEITGAAYESHGVPLWKDVEGVLTLRTAAEIKADVDEIPVPERKGQKIKTSPVTGSRHFRAGPAGRAFFLGFRVSRFPARSGARRDSPPEWSRACRRSPESRPCG